MYRFESELLLLKLMLRYVGNTPGRFSSKLSKRTFGGLNLVEIHINLFFEKILPISGLPCSNLALVKFMGGGEEDDGAVA